MRSHRFLAVPNPPAGCPDPSHLSDVIQELGRGQALLGAGKLLAVVLEKGQQVRVQIEQPATAGERPHLLSLLAPFGVPSQPVGKTLRCARQSSARLRELPPGRNAGHRAGQPRTTRRPGDPLLWAEYPGRGATLLPSPRSPGEEDDAVLHRAAAHPPPALPDQLLLRARQHPALHSGAGKSPPGEPAPVPAARGPLRTQRGRQRSGARNRAEPPALRPPPCPRAPPGRAVPRRAAPRPPLRAGGGPASQRASVISG